MANEPIPSQAKPRKKPGIGTYLLKYGVPLLISIGLCWLLFTGVDFNEMVSIIRHDCDFRWIALAMTISVISHIVRAARWRIQLRALGIDVPLFVVVLSIFGTYAVNLVLPRLGELWRTGWIAQRQRAPFDTVFGSMVADRLADTVTVALLTGLAFVLAHSQLMSYLSQNAAGAERLVELLSNPWLWGAVILLAGGVFAIFKTMPDNRFVAKTIGFLKGLWQGFAVIATMPGKGRWALLTLLLWGCYFIQLYVAFFAFPVTAAVVARYGIVAPFVCFVLSSISMGVPSNGGIGPWQWAVIFGLMMYSADITGLTEAYAGSFANLVMGSQTLLLIALGLFTFVTIAVMKRRNSNA